MALEISSKQRFYYWSMIDEALRMAPVVSGFSFNVT